MRLKPSFPQFLSSKRRQLQSFCFHFHASRQPIESELPKIGQAKKRKLIVSEERELMHTYPHYIYLLRDAAPEDLLLQTVSLPVDTAMITVLQACQKPVLYFNNTAFVLVWRDDQSIREYVSETGDAVIPLLFAASSNLLDVYYRLVNDCLHLDICIKSRCIESAPLQSTRLISQIQYEKIHNFLTLQCMLDTSATMMPDFSVFLRTRHSETQAEFVTLIKLLYDCAQTRHNSTHRVWDLIDTSSIQNADLLTQLRPYQVDAVKWMAYQESHVLQVDAQRLHRAMFWPVPLASSTQRKVYFSLMTGTFVDQLPTFQPPCLGGILADEMGLGKTLELIALILLHPWSDWSVSGGHLRNFDGELCSDEFSDYDAPTPPMMQDDRPCQVLCSCGNVDETRGFSLVQCTRCDGPRQHAVCVQYDPSTFTDRLPIEHGYICPQCWSHLRIDSKATLIVAPDHIWQQWKEELQAHVARDSVDILLYAGMEAPVTPVELGGRASTTGLKSTNVNPYAPRTRVTALRTAASQPDQMEEELLLPGFVQPGQLACADIVLTSYSVVQRELDWAEVVAERRSGLGHRPGLRLAPRYMCRPSPLTCVRWWRVCLDEAQMVERITSKTARMMSQIDAKHRWCVTGTPAEKSIDDLYGLFAYLRFEPFSIRHYWHCLLYQPFLAATAPSWPTNSDCTVAQPTLSAVQSTHLADMLSMVLWRNTKALVGDQLSLPPITEQVHWINFTPVERYIHDRVLAQSAGALDRLSRTMCISPDQPLASLPGAVHWRLVYLITRLRQACTHASLVVVTGASSRRMRARVHQADPNRHRLGHGPEIGYVDDDDDMYYTNPGALNSSAVRDGPSVSAARAHRNFGTGCSTMTEVVRRVVDDTRRECEGLLRSWVFNKNGAAGCFIIKQQYDLAAECYRDVLRTADTLERNHGVLADWSQRLHAITNLNWLIQSRGVPLLDEPPPSSVDRADLRSLSDGSTMELDPRVDRDLLAKAERLRSAYIQMHSHLLARVHENLEPVVIELDSELDHSVTLQNGIENFEDASDSPSSHLTYPYGAGWLTWFSDAIQFLISCGVGPNLIEMLVASFQGKPGANRSGYRTTLLHAGSANSFKALLLTEVVGVFQARKRLREAMQPVMATWRSFKAGEEADPKILQPFYSCCARTSTEATEDVERKEFENSEDGSDNPSTAVTNHKIKKEARELKQLIKMSGNMREAGQKKKVRTRCAYCVALRALSSYQAALNHERLKSGTQAMIEQEEFDDHQSDEIGSGLVLGNPLLVALTIVCHQTTKLVGKAPVADNPSIGKDWPSRARRFEALFRQMGKEVMLTSRTLSLTKEWWNIHDDTEQFVIRLQATCPTDLAFIHSHEVEEQLRTYVVEAHLVWPHLQSRLGHFGFLRNAHLAAMTGGPVATGRRDPDDPSSSTGPTFRLECPTCLQSHSPNNPTFALLPGCWHTLCMPCYNRIASLGQPCQHRCPVCRTPFQSNDKTSGHNARRRRPLTLIHYDGEGAGRSVVTNPELDADNVECTVVGDHSSKVKAVVRCLKEIKQMDPDAKAIVFSSWLSVLITIAGALDQNDLSYTTLFQPRDACCPGRLAGFQYLGSATWILLMPIQLGANGLNLTSANHVLLIDPVLSHGREAQAIARMHRIGQTRPSVVHRFLVRDSIEAALHAAHSKSKQADTFQTHVYLGERMSSDCMIGAGIRRTSATPSGLAGPSEDRAQLMQLTIGQLAELLHRESNSVMISNELKWPEESHVC